MAGATDGASCSPLLVGPSPSYQCTQPLVADSYPSFTPVTRLTTEQAARQNKISCSGCEDEQRDARPTEDAGGEVHSILISIYYKTRDLNQRAQIDCERHRRDNVIESRMCGRR